ncbi:heterokaryon incompatibility protein-domain-containing protein [Hyaloscypha finlandica]|nr:heterokaryon incompatibility protein-domain-containing protein [Hyaloscypha finlandica]
MALEIYTTLSSTLKQFRIVKLLPGSSTIECTLLIDSLLRGTPSVRYEALSYEWGDTDSPMHEIILQGKHFRVRENLWMALRSLRASSYRTAEYWIDAICINQDNISERNQQVAMMGDIFRKASSVRVWLGDDGRNEHESNVKDAFGLVKNWFPLSEERAKELVSKQATAQKKWEALAFLLGRTYWTRLWIVQEYLSAREVVIHYGRHSFDNRHSSDNWRRFGTFDEGLSGIARIKSNHPGLPPYLPEILERIKASPGMRISRARLEGGHPTLLELLETCKTSKSSVPHDRIYALLGVASDISEDSIPVDYDRSIFKVKMDVAWFIQSRPKHIPGMVRRICSILDETFADVEEESD